jgi:beta-carotene hydroxylase
VKFFYTQNSFSAKSNCHSAQLTECIIYCAELCVSLGWRVLTIVLIDPSGIAAVVLMGYFFGRFFTAYSFAYRPHFLYDNTQRYLNTNSLIMPIWMRPVEWFWRGQNLHFIHHLVPRVPFYRYHALHRQIGPILRAHGRPVLGVWSGTPVKV